MRGEIRPEMEPSQKPFVSRQKKIRTEMEKRLITFDPGQGTKSGK